MAKETWLPLTDYSNKYKVSISTLRRRIKSSQAEFIYEEGKYLLKDAPLSNHEFASPELETEASSPAHKAPLNTQNDRTRVTTAPPQQALGHSEIPITNDQVSSALADGSVNNEAFVRLEGAVQKLINELKQAYALILQEKEEQIIMLKEEVTDLKTLVRVLENENDRLQTDLKEGAPIDSWLE